LKKSPYISVKNLTKIFQMKGGLFSASRPLRAVNSVSFDIPVGETFGLVGESGAGKSTIAKMVMGALQANEGKIRVSDVHVDTFEQSELLRLRRLLQPVFQDPYSSLDPSMRISSIIDEPLRVQRLCKSAAERKEKVAEVLGEVGLSADSARLFPSEMSGGQRQRVAIARSLVINPQCLVLDEPVSALDVSVQAQILNLLKDIQVKNALTYLLISHDFAVVSFICTQIGVLYLGEFMEVGSRNDIIRNAHHPYTKALISTADPAAERRLGIKAADIKGEIPSPMSPPGGCPFHPRCPVAVERCKSEKPLWREVEKGHLVACHLA